MDRGRMLADAAHVLVQVAGGPGMTLSEVEILMQELGKHVRDNTQILFGTAVDGRMGNRLSVTIISSLAAEGESAPPANFAPVEAMAAPEPVAALPPPIWEQPQAKIAPISDIAPEPVEEQAALASAPEPEALVPAEPPVSIEAPILSPPPAIHKPGVAPRLIVPKKKPLPVPMKEAKPTVEKIVQAKQEVMQFEPVTRGRFEKSEPTIVEGQDLDIPTFLRKNIRVK
jgi:cell division protein FtsZ